MNAIIEKNKETIMANFQKDNTRASDFENPTPLSDPSHPLFGKIPPSIGPKNHNNLFYIPHKENNPTIFEAMYPNIPSTQLGAPIPPNPQNTITQSLVHSTSHRSIFTQTKLPFTPIVIVASQPTSLPLIFPPQTIS